LLGIGPASALLASIALAQSGAVAPTTTDPANPSAEVPVLRYESVLSGYRPMQDESPLPWTGLFAPNGEFVDEATLRRQATVEITVRKPAPGHGGHDSHGPVRTISIDPPTGATAAVLQAPVAASPHPDTYRADSQTASAGRSDTRARIESIDKTAGKVKLKHGPIPKLDMPAMTMVFRVQDPRLLDLIKEGDEVGVTVDKVGASFVITGFQK
jgi:Cu/Ag efflux protein CusF